MQSSTIYGTFQLKKHPEKADEDKSDSNQDEITREGDVENGPPDTETRNSDTGSGQLNFEENTGSNAGNVAISDREPESPYYFLEFVSFVDIGAPIIIPGFIYLQHQIRKSRTISGNMEKGSFIYVPIAMAYVFQITMGIILLLKQYGKVCNNCAMSKFLIMYHIFSAVVAGLLIFVMVFPFLFGKDTANHDGVNPVIVSQAAMLLCLRVPIFAEVERNRRSSESQA